MSETTADFIRRHAEQLVAIAEQFAAEDSSSTLCECSESTNSRLLSQEFHDAWSATLSDLFATGIKFGDGTTPADRAVDLARTSSHGRTRIRHTVTALDNHWHGSCRDQ